MTRYRLDIVRDGRRWCETVVDTAEAAAVLRDTALRFPATEGFRMTVWREHEARRLVEVTDQARTVCVTYRGEAVDLDALIADKVA